MQKTIGMITVALLSAFLVPVTSQAQDVDLSANAGWVSEYYYRGIPQKTSSASAGLDLAASGLYLGTWAADVGDGAEVDLYGGYGFEYEGFSLSVGATGYFYTGEFDNTYLEGNLGAGLGPLSLEVSYGTYDDQPDDSDVDDSKYLFVGLTAEHEGLYGTVGTFGSDFEGSYVEAGYGFTVADELDLFIAGIFSDENLSFAVDGDGEPTGELTFVFGISKAFSLN